MQPINFALEIGRKLQKKQTGFVHYCYQSEDQMTHDTIPVLENALFALSLFRSRLSDNVLEGKAQIEKLLPFEVKGNFPVYLHTYPQTTDPYLGLRLLPVLFWIAVDFGHVIGGLKRSLEECIGRIVAHAKTLTPLSHWGQMRLDAYEGRVGALPRTLNEWSEGLISLQLAEKRGADIIQPIREAFEVWHPELSLYIGPALRRNQEGHLPEVTLFDLFMSQWQNHFSKRVNQLAPIHLHGALIRPLSFVPDMIQAPVPYIHFNKEEECPLLIAWEEHTFVLAKQHLAIEGNVEELLLHLNEEEMPVNFYFNYHSDHEITINGEKANTFQQGDKVEIRSKGVVIELSFSSADGKYMGHLLRGNRPSQHSCRGENLYAAYDWRIALRTISPGNAPMQVRLQVLRDCPLGLVKE